jgi:hypothetical protein
MTDADGMCCRGITVSTKRFADANGYRSLDTFSLAIERVDGKVIPLGIASVERLVEFVRELNPPTVHLAALEDEHEALIAEIRAIAAGDMVTALLTGPDTPRARLH